MYKTLLLLTVAVLTFIWCRPSSASPDMARYTRDREDMAKTLNFLRKLDDYYSQLSRPSRWAPQKRNDPAMVNAYLQLLAMDRFYSHQSRPRFGKRDPGYRRYENVRFPQERAALLGRLVGWR